MFNLGGMEILVILVVALLVLGPEKLPKFMRTIGKVVGDLRRVSTEFQRTVNLEINADSGMPAPKPAETENPDSQSATPEPHSIPAPPAAEAAPKTPSSISSFKRKSISRAKLTRRTRPRPRSNRTDMDTP